MIDDLGGGAPGGILELLTHRQASSREKANVYKRGVYRAGYYLAVLRSLELHYRIETAADGGRIERIQPLPRNRPDQFLRWITSSLAEVDIVLPTRYGALLETLQGQCLAQTARVLDHVVRRRLSKVAPGLDPGPLPLDELRTRLGSNDSSSELHPQVRKMAGRLRRTLDERWMRAILAVEQEQSALPWPRVSVILGGLPPGFGAVHDQVMTGLLVKGGPADHPDLNVLQFYGLATGSIPGPPEDWRSAIDHLLTLSDDEIWLLKSLSSNQIGQLRRLNHEAFVLVILLKSLRRATPQWRRLVTTLHRTADEGGDASMRALLQRWKQVYRLEIRQLEGLRRITHEQSWHQVESLDEELVRMIDRGEFSLALFQSVQRWPPRLWGQIRRLLERDWAWITGYLDDYRSVQQYSNLRTPARLELRALFPQTIAWLDQLIGTHPKVVLLRDLEEVTGFAEQYSGLVLENLFEVGRRSAGDLKVRKAE